MALSKKKSRPITVGGERFRYIVNLSRNQGNEVFDLNVTIQTESGEGAKLVTSIKTRDFWLDFPDIVNWQDYVTLTPQQIADIIHRGMKHGWNPRVNGKPFILEINESVP